MLEPFCKSKYSSATPCSYSYYGVKWEDGSFAQAPLNYKCIYKVANQVYGNLYIFLCFAAFAVVLLGVSMAFLSFAIVNNEHSITLNVKTSLLEVICFVLILVAFIIGLCIFFFTGCKTIGNLTKYDGSHLDDKFKTMKREDQIRKSEKKMCETFSVQGLKGVAELKGCGTDADCGYQVAVLIVDGRIEGKTN